MPQFIKKDGCHYVAYITGPRHILLGVRLGRTPAVGPTVVKQGAIGECNHVAIDEALLVHAVTEGVREGVEESGYEVSISEIVYVENDSPAYDLYQNCARLIVLRLAAGDEFTIG